MAADALSPERRALLDRLLDEAGVGRPADAIPRLRADGELPLSFAQERLWFLDHLRPGSAEYAVPGALHLLGPLDAAALGLALAEVVARHQALRATFATAADGSPRQRIAAPHAPDLAVVDLRGAPAPGRERQLRRHVQEEVTAPFDLTRGPLLRARLLRLGDHEHVLVVNVHHIACDGWSLDRLFQETAQLYQAFAAGSPSPLPPLPLQYADFAAWQRASLADPGVAAQLAWWVDHLRDAPQVLDLAADRPRPAARSGRGRRRPIALSASVATRLRALARRHGATPFMVLLASFSVLLHRCSGSDDLLVGCPVGGRPRSELEPLIGNFVNTLPLRCDLRGDPAFAELLARVRDETLAALDHQDVPFELLVERLHVQRDLARTPLFQATFVHHTADSVPDRDGELVVRRLDVDNGTAKFDLTLAAVDDGTTIQLALEYATDLFESASAKRMLAWLVRLLDTAATDPDRRLRELAGPDAAEGRWLLDRSRGPGGTPPGQPTLHAAFEAQAARAPYAVAVTCEGERLTYGDLDRRANQLARHLRGLGVTAGDLVGVCLDRSVELVVALLGVLKAGAAYVPLDPVDPPERLAFMLADAGARVVVGRQALLEWLPAGVTPVRLDRDGSGIAALPADNLRLDLAPEQLAYAMYTSGSTGRPKAVAVTHGNVLRLFSSTRQWFGFGDTDVWTLFHSYAFDFSVWELWGALLHGGRLVVVPWQASRTPAAFAELLDGERVTGLKQAPSAFRLVAALDGRPGEHLRLVIFGGEALDVAGTRAWLERHGDHRPGW